MNQLQAELDATHPQLDIEIVGVNELGRESANALMTAGRSLPWLQDVDANNNQISDVWREQWDVVYRDVVIVDKTLTDLGAFNLTTYDLADTATYNALREILLDVASDQPFWQNETNALDVNQDGIVSAQGDVLPCINELNNRFLTDNAGRLPGLRLPPLASEPHLDVNGDGLLTAQADVLPIINFLNNQGNAEGESTPATALDSVAEIETPRETIALSLPQPERSPAVWWTVNASTSSASAGAATGFVPHHLTANADLVTVPRVDARGFPAGANDDSVDVNSSARRVAAASPSELMMLHASLAHQGNDALEELVDLLAFDATGRTASGGAG